MFQEKRSTARLMVVTMEFAFSTSYRKTRRSRSDVGLRRQQPKEQTNNNVRIVQNTMPYSRSPMQLQQNSENFLPANTFLELPSFSKLRISHTDYCR